MQVSYSPKPHNRVDYYPLPNGYVDVYLHKDERTETDEDGNVVYITEEVYFQVKQEVTKEQIENDFNYFWEDADMKLDKPTAEERLEALESAVLDMILGGTV